MTKYENQIYEGTVKVFKGHFGFIESELGDTFFHKSGLTDEVFVDIGDVVKFKIEPSTKKEGAYQATEITLIKKNERYSDPDAKLVIGVLKWYNGDQGYGIIGTPENQDYFLHKSNLKSSKTTVEKGTVLVFEDRIGKDKIEAINCRLAQTYGDWQLALNYLSKNDNVVVESKVPRSSYRLRRYSSNHTEQISLLTNSSFQILNKKKKEVIIKIISDYFNDNLQEKSSEEQLLYFNLIKKIFENSLMKEGSEILTRFFTRFKEFVVRHQDLSFSLWLKGYSQEKDLNYIAEKLSEGKVNLYSPLYKQIFENLLEAKEQGQVLNTFLSKIGFIERPEEYNKITAFLNFREIF